MSIRAKLKSLFLLDADFSYIPHLSEWHLALLSLTGLGGCLAFWVLFPILGIFGLPLIMGVVAYIEALLISWAKKHQS